MGTPSAARIIKDVDLVLKSFKIFFCRNGSAVQVLDDRNGQLRNVVGKGKFVSWTGAQTKGEGRDCKLTKNMFLHSDLLMLFLKKKHNITKFFPDTTIFCN